MKCGKRPGLTIGDLQLLDVVDSLNRDNDGALAYHYTLIDFLARWKAGEPKAGGDALEALWAPCDALEGYDLWDETLRLISLALEAGTKRG